MRMAFCDDDEETLNWIQGCICRNQDFFFYYDVFLKPEDLLASIEKQPYDLFVLDIEMPGMSGLELAKEIRKQDKKALFVFVTSHAHYMPMAFEVYTFDYISKPMTEIKFYNMIAKVTDYLTVTHRNFTFHYRKKRYSLSYDDIIYLEKHRRQAFIHTINRETYVTNMTIAEIWMQLDHNIFVHTHASYIANMCYIRRIEKDEVHMVNEVKLTISRGCRQELLENHMSFTQRVI